tara:strand:- start:20664 stop:22466 length:1803 start_codon:yes stop_codon:yes gene_type:complete
MPYTQLNNLDFNNIKTALKDYMRAQSEFTDYDFEGSALSQLLDVLAYNTYYTAFNTNMVVNELFLDSSTLRDNVVALAKQLGYTPKSIASPTAGISFEMVFPGTAPQAVILKAGSGFLTNYDNGTYRYIARADERAEVINGTATFTDISFREGSLVTTRTSVNGASNNQRFKIENSSVDTTTIEVKVFQSNNSSVFDEYKIANNILDVGSNDKVYFINEIEDEAYELFFGDGVLGRKLENGEVVEISYIVTNGTTTNGAKQFSYNAITVDENYVPVTYPFSVNNVTTTSIASGGANIESIDKIKYNAPKFYGSQNRAVTTADYGAIVRELYPAVSDIIVFGGEDQEPPAYGKVFIALKPTNASSLSSFTKSDLSKKLKQYTVASVKPEFIDVSILYIEIASSVYYSGSKSELLPAQMAAKATLGVQEYLKTSSVEKFNGKFRYSKLVGTIDGSDPAINSNITDITLRKDFIAQINSSTYYEVCYQNEFAKDCDGPVVSSTGMIVFEYPEYTTYLEDRSGKMVLYRIDSTTGEKILLNDSVGDVYYDKGEIKLYDFTILKGSFSDNRVELRVKPAKNDIEVKREVYLDVDISKSTFVAYKE